MQYPMIIERGERNYSAHFPDLPGCIATAKTLDELKQRMREALELHLRARGRTDYQSLSQAWLNILKLRDCGRQQETLWRKAEALPRFILELADAVPLEFSPCPGEI